MKKLVKTVSLALLLILVSLCIFCCNSSVSATEPSAYYSDHWYIKAEKTEYDLGDEMTVIVLFAPDETEKIPDNYTYYIKLAESPSYEIIGEAVVSAERCDCGGIFEGDYTDDFLYKAIIKIKVTEEFAEEQPLTFYIDCVESDWLREIYNHEKHRRYSEDPDYDTKLVTDRGFTSDSDGVYLPYAFHHQSTVIVKLPAEYYFFNTLAFIFEKISEFFKRLFAWVK